MPDGSGPAVQVRTTCPYCGVGCGVLMKPDGGAPSGWRATGDPDHPANFGRLCSKGSALGETIGLDGRLLHPEIGGRRVSWDEALDAVARGFARSIERHGPDSVALYLSGQILTEDYYVANKLAKGFLGTANVDTNSRLCMASSVAGHKRAFGADTVPGCYEDLDEADLLVLVGSNAAWCHPVLWQRMQRNRETRGARIVVIDPRATATADGIDLHLAIAPGMDAALFEGLLVHLAETGRVDEAYVEAHTAGFGAALAAAVARVPTVEAAAAATGLEADAVALFFDLWAGTGKVVTLYSQGVNQSAQGVDKVGAILNCHLAAGRIGRPGTGPFSLTGQPNAMGGREVGGLANQLAAHMDFAPAAIDRVARFWGATRMAREPGLKAVDLFDAVEAGRIRALWIIGTNPAVSLPEADRVRAALGRLDCLVVSEVVASNDTIGPAHVRLPAAAWGEKGGTVTNSERRVSRQRPFLDLPGEARPDWWALAEVGRRLAPADAFAYEDAAAVYREHAALSAFENDGTRDFDLGAHAAIDRAGYDALPPFQWPLPKGTATGRSRFFAEGGFYTPDRRARFVVPAPPALAETAREPFPLVLNTGRVRDQWHTMTRTGKSPTLGQHRPEPLVEVHPDDAERAGLTDGGLARLRNARGTAVLRVAVTEAQRRGSVFAPIHWSDENASAARIGALVASRVDPISGQPEAKATPVAIGPVEAGLEAVLVTLDAPARARLEASGALYWARTRIAGGWATFLALPAAAAEDWPALAAGLLATVPDDLVAAGDPAARHFRAARYRDGRLAGALVLAPAPERPAWAHLKDLLGADPSGALRRRAPLASRSAAGAPDPGPTVCACFAVGRNAIEAAARNGCATPAAIGETLKAGTNCGSCLPEIRRLLETVRA
ncbi:nitrate reductase [Prosthecomicrobium sp. N25]|uniref:nitrate reductase n=1 Tax=Prosthecomicrobium sp. N25 TaxID=3129254 RepID=UPI0030784F36